MPPKFNVVHHTSKLFTVQFLRGSCLVKFSCKTYIKVLCIQILRPPSGCLQYHTDLKGEITTFNYGTAQESYHLNPQSYSICIRRAEGKFFDTWLRMKDIIF